MAQPLRCGSPVSGCDNSTQVGTTGLAGPIARDLETLRGGQPSLNIATGASAPSLLDSMVRSPYTFAQSTQVRESAEKPSYHTRVLGGGQEGSIFERMLPGVGQSYQLNGYAPLPPVCLIAAPLIVDEEPAERLVGIGVIGGY